MVHGNLNARNCFIQKCEARLTDFRYANIVNSKTKLHVDKHFASAKMIEYIEKDLDAPCM